VARLKQTGLIHRTELHLGYVDELPPEKSFDAVTLIGVLHHLPGDEAKRAILGSLAVRLKPGAPLIVACKRS
jgi:tRNA (cmo5U34)-methyltransferase